jgi:hypothetical protein
MWKPIPHIDKLPRTSHEVDDENNSNLPYMKECLCIFVIGASGDLAKKKVHIVHSG